MPSLSPYGSVASTPSLKKHTIIHSTTTIDISPADHSLHVVRYHPEPRAAFTSRCKNIFKGRSLKHPLSSTPVSKATPFSRWQDKQSTKNRPKRHFSDEHIPEGTEERLRNWKGLYQKQLDGLLEEYKGPGKARIEDEKLEHWGTSYEDAQPYLVFRWAEGLKKGLMTLLEKNGASQHAEGCFLFMVEVRKGERRRKARMIWEDAVKG